jgi:hypothetical protein
MRYYPMAWPLHPMNLLDRMVSLCYLHAKVCLIVFAITRSAAEVSFNHAGMAGWVSYARDPLLKKFISPQD